MKKRLLNRLIAGIPAYIAMLFLILFCVLGECTLLLNDSALHERVACSAEITERQTEEIHSRIDSLATVYSFDPAPLKELTNADTVKNYAKSVIRWWMDTLHGKDAGEIPAWDYHELMETVRADPAFTASVESYEQRVVARDKIAGVIAKTATTRVSGIREELLEPVIGKVRGKIDFGAYVDLLPWFTAFALLVAFALLAMTRLIALKRTDGRRICGYAFGGTALALIGIIVLLYLAQIPATVAECSELLSMQAAGLEKRIAIHLLVMALICAVIYIKACLKGRKTFDEEKQTNGDPECVPDAEGGAGDPVRAGC